jgi:elongation factor 1 alpha-like protein
MEPSDGPGACGGGDESSWACPNCTFLNAAECGECAGCGFAGEEEGGEVDDWELLEEPYEVVLDAFPKNSESSIVAALRASRYDPELAILHLRRQKAAKKKRQSGGGGGSGGGSGTSSARGSSGDLTALKGADGGSGVGSASSPVSSAGGGFGALPALPAALRAEFEAARPRLALACIGHVDAGKSTLLGRLLFELGLVPERVLARCAAEAREADKGSFAFAWLLDSGAEERARGVTVEVGCSYFSGAAADVTILDAPGHREFVPNMIGGVAQADAVVLLVDASLGAFEAGFSLAGGGGQTREHALLARAFGVTQAVVAVNKMDAPGVAWSRLRYDAIVAAMSPFLFDEAGFKKEAVRFVPVSGLTGVNLVRGPEDVLERAVAEGGGGGGSSGGERGGGRAGDCLADLLQGLGFGEDAGGATPSSTGSGSGGGGAKKRGGGGALDASALRSFAAWYGRGPTLLGAIEALRAPARTADPPRPLRLCVSDVYPGAGGMCVAGRVESGWVAPGHRVIVCPGGGGGAVKAVCRGGAPVGGAAAGDVVELLLGGFSDEAAARALAPPAVLAAAAAPAPAALKFKARLQVLPGVALPLMRGQVFTLHTGGAAEPVALARLLRTLDKATLRTAALKPRVLVAGNLAVVRLALARRICVTTFADNKRMGRFVLRYHGVTVAAGQVVKITR